MAQVLSDVADVDDLLTVRMSRVLPATRERVFKAWTDPEIIVRWWGPKGIEALSAEADPRAGGGFSVRMRDQDGEIHTLSGIYTELDPPELICLEMRHRTFEGAAERPEGYIPTHVRVELKAHADGTELNLIHSGFLDAAIAGRFNGGWAGVLDKLAATFQ